MLHYDMTGMTWSQGDFNGDGVVNDTDLTILLAHFDEVNATSRAPRLKQRLPPR